MIEQDLYTVCLYFRQVIEKINKDKLSVGFKTFPLGSCGDSSLILGAFLHEKGYGIYEYISGTRNNYSHAWLEKDQYVIDITSDQFEDGNGPVYIGVKNNFYDSFYETARRKYFQSFDKHSILNDQLAEDYITICTEFDAKFGH